MAVQGPVWVLRPFRVGDHTGLPLLVIASFVRSNLLPREGPVLICKDADNTVRWKPGERLNHYFEQRCDQVPADHLAVITEDVSLTFRDLDNRANQAARFLLDQGLKAGDRIGLLFDKSVHSYVALLAVLKIGAAYVPFDASFPGDRIAFILEDAGVKAIVSVSRYRSKLTEFS